MTGRASGRAAAGRLARRRAVDILEDHDWQGEAKAWRRKAGQVERLVRLGSFEVDLETCAMTWSAGTHAIFGLPAGSLVTLEQALGFFDPGTRRTIGRHVAAARISGEAFDITVAFRSGKGVAGWLRGIGQVETGEGAARLVGTVRDITRERESEERLLQQADLDLLTGLPNRQAFQAHLEQAAERHPVRPLAVCLVDIDRFKAVNEAHGQATGDALLQEVGRRLSRAVRPRDVVARIGADEFAVVLHGTRAKAGLIGRAGALLAAVRQPFVVGQAILEPTISVGACLSGAKAVRPALTVRQADVALAKARLNGRDTVCLFERGFRKEVDDHGRLMDEVQAGLARGQFEVHYQPIVDLRTHIVRGWEALVRWNHPVKGLLLPGQFLAALMDPAGSVAIDDFVLDASLRQMRQWLDHDVPVTCAGVNVSETQLKRVDLVARITGLLERYRLTPDRLKIEVLETAFVGHSTQAVAATIDQLARLGVVSALDDFGTGYASLTHLKQFRVERIKIDRSFVANLGVSGFDLSIVRCMIALGRDLGIRITAEGIETPEQLRILQRLGCDCGQGYLFGRPMHPDAVPGFLTRWHGHDAAKLLGGDDGTRIS